MTQQEWTGEMVAERFEEAIRILKQLKVPNTKPRGYFSSWPEIVYTTWEVMAQDQPKLRLPQPTPEQIQFMEDTFDWLLLLEEPISRHLIWFRAKRLPWKMVCSYTGYSRTTSWQMWSHALEIVARELNAKKKIQGA